MQYKPVGYYILVEMDKISEEIEEGALAGFQLDSKEVKREQHGHAIGTIKAFGPTCYKGFEGCESPDDWGVKVGDRVEFNRYDGKECLAEGYEHFRLIPDSNIVAILESK